MNRKSQQEIIGLLIIVVIISMLLLFVLTYMSKKPDDLKETFIKKDISSSMIGAILTTHSGCTPDTQMSQLLIDCVKTTNMPGRQLTCDNGSKSCEFAGGLIETMLSETLDKWSQEYDFRVYWPPNQLIEELSIQSDGLPDTKRTVDTTPQPLPVDNYQTDMEIKLCIGGKCPDTT